MTDEQRSQTGWIGVQESVVILARALSFDENEGKMLRLVGILTLLSLPATALSVQKELLERLSEKHRRWLEEEVVYIMADREREVFLSVETLEEREGFVEAFWRKRDPNPATPVNEFKDEHYARLDYANEFLGRESFLPGWRTDMGRYWIILGNPATIQRFTGKNELKETELWFYQGDGSRGLPAFFYLLFFKRDDVGHYQLYHPMLDGPTALLRGMKFDANQDNFAALEKLEEISLDLADASLSFDTGQPPDYLTGRPSISVDAMLARVEESPKRAIRTDYVRAWELYGRRVSADYSFNFVANRHVFTVMAGPDGTPIVHFSVELDPASFGFETDEDQSKYYTTLDVTVEATDTEGRLVLVNNRSSYIELSAAQIEQVQRAPVAYQDDLPLVPGSYTLSVILRNRALKNYTVAEREMEIPAFATGTPALTGVVLCHKSTMARTGDPTEIRTFQLGSLLVEPASNGLFAIGEPVLVFAQAYQAQGGYSATFELVGADEKVFDSTEIKDAAADGGALIGGLSTLGMTGGNYTIRVRLVRPTGELAAEKTVPIVVSPRTAVARPAFVYRRGFNTKIPGLLALARGDQLWNMGRHDEAQAELEKAVAANNPNLPQAHWKLATAYLRNQDSNRALRLLSPLEPKFPTRFEVIAGMGFAYYFRQDFQRAAGYLDRAMGIRPPDTSLLNAAADSYQQLGDADKAREYFERSLQIDPAQDAIKDRIAALSSQGG